jgi:hypothetical protein
MDRTFSPKRRPGMRTPVIASALLVCVLLGGCTESTSPFDYRKEVVVNATLVANERMGDVMLTWTGSVDGLYSASALGIRGALVIVRDVTDPHSDTLAPDQANPGRYAQPFALDPVHPLHTYELYVRTPEPDVRIVTGRTSIPDTFSIIRSSLHNGDTVRYDLNAPVHSFEWAESRNFAAYLPTVTALDVNPALIPKVFYGDTASAGFTRPSRIIYRIGLPKAQTHSDIPWVFLNYYGRTRFDVFAVDENCSDFLDQWLALQTGELKEIRYKLQGGIGLFCSKSRAGNGVEISLVK